MPLVFLLPLDSYLLRNQVFLEGGKKKSRVYCDNLARLLNKFGTFPPPLFFPLNFGWTLEKKKKNSHPNGLLASATDRWGGGSGSGAHLGKAATWWWSDASVFLPDNISLFGREEIKQLQGDVSGNNAGPTWVSKVGDLWRIWAEEMMLVKKV